MGAALALATRLGPGCMPMGIPWANNITLGAGLALVACLGLSFMPMGLLRPWQHASLGLGSVPMATRLGLACMPVRLTWPRQAGTKAKGCLDLGSMHALAASQWGLPLPWLHALAFNACP